ncbi:MAG TPA: cytochrome c oxidase subunit II, partial [Vicinamibacterales bacterium]|nr:cytochrome c oxidase subunit II [Vicinamibacterales bacterium]
MMPTRIQSALDAAGLQAGRIEVLWWIMFWVCAAVYVAVIGALVIAMVRGRSADRARPGEGSLLRGVAVATGLTVVILVGLLVASVVTGRAIGSLSSSEPVMIRVTGYQWWWKVEYPHSDPSQHFTTANELHLPVGRPVAVRLQSADVIHSFWVPNLHGKMDLIPGRENWIWIQADTPGVYRGQCAEFCGLQHAHMSLVVIAESSDQYEQWAHAQRQPAAPPTTPQQSRGLNIVERGPCAMCHAIRGTIAGAVFGPDLTHFASRSTIGAGTAPNTRGYLAGWIADPQQLKP